MFRIAYAARRCSKYSTRLPSRHRIDLTTYAMRRSRRLGALWSEVSRCSLLVLRVRRPHGSRRLIRTTAGVPPSARCPCRELSDTFIAAQLPRAAFNAVSRRRASIAATASLARQAVHVDPHLLDLGDERRYHRRSTTAHTFAASCSVRLVPFDDTVRGRAGSQSVVHAALRLARGAPRRPARAAPSPAPVRRGIA